jgi:DNA-binding SARP family transcriptional activator
MRFKVLGPLEIETDDAPLVGTGRRPRALLVALLLKPRVVVSTARLVDALWEELRLGCLEGRVELLLRRGCRLTP